MCGRVHNDIMRDILCEVAGRTVGTAQCFLIEMAIVAVAISTLKDNLPCLQ